jgi:4-azaleucine resistance transporter AzlC
MGYVPLGMAFGLLAVKCGIEWPYAVAMSVIIFAGSGQFLTATLFAAGAGYFTIFTAIFLLNLRHFFYGLSMISEFKPIKGLAKKYIIFGLTDETFALLKTLDIPQNEKPRAFLLITALNQCYWILGSAIGAGLGTNLAFDSHGIEFCLTALFVVLGIELYRQNHTPKPLALALIIGAAGMFVLPSSQMLVITLFVCLAALVAFRPWIEEAR